MSRGRRPGVICSQPVEYGHPRNRGRAAWWLTLPHLAGGPQWVDLMGFSPGTLTNMTTFASGWRGTTRPGGFGHLLFDGTDDAVTVGDLDGGALDVTGPELTLAAWVYPAASGNYQFLAGRTAAGFVRQYAFYLAPTTDAVFATTNGPGGGPIGLSPSWAVGRWNHLVVTYNGSGYVCYLDGLPAGTAATSGPIVTVPGASVCLGREQPSANFPLAGGLDDVSIWSRALPAAEVRALHDESRAGYPGMLRRWRSAVAMLGGAAPAGGYRVWYAGPGRGAALGSGVA